MCVKLVVSEVTKLCYIYIVSCGIGIMSGILTLLGLFCSYSSMKLLYSVVCTCNITMKKAVLLKLLLIIFVIINNSFIMATPLEPDETTPSQEPTETTTNPETETNANPDTTPQSTVDMIELFDKTVAENEATFVVFYRGVW